MGKVSVALTGMPTNYARPGTYLEVQFAQGTLLGNPGIPKVLIIGPKRSTGTATNDTMVYSASTEASVITLTGAGSPVHRAWKRFTQICSVADVYFICPAESAGTPATDTMTFAVNATGAGVASYTCCGETVQVSYSSGDAFDTVIAAGMVAAINAQTHWPVIAVQGIGGASGQVIITAKIKGTNGNWIRHRGSVTAGTGVTCSVTLAKLATGAVDETYTTALTTILASQYDYIVPCINPTSTADTRLSALTAQMTAQALPTTGIRAQAIVATQETLATATTFASGQNKPRLSIVWQKNGEFESIEAAAIVAGVRYNKETGADPGVSYDSYGLKVNDVWTLPGQYSVSDYPTAADINTAVSVGLTPIGVTSSKATYIVMSCTSAGADPRIRDASKVTVCDRFAADLASRYGSQWAGAKVADDVANGATVPPANVCTPDRLKSLTITPLLAQYESLGLLTHVSDSGGSIASTACGLDPVVTTRINARIPLYVTPLLHQFAGLISESSSG